MKFKIVRKEHVGEPIKIGEKVYKLLKETWSKDGELVDVAAQGTLIPLSITLTKDEFSNGLKDATDISQD